MQIRNFSVLLFLTFHFMVFGGVTPEVAKTTETPVETTNWSCNLPAPTNFHVIEIGTDWAGLEWTPSVYLPDHYRVRTYRASNNTLLDDRTVMGTATMCRVFNLPAGETVYSKITPVCEDNAESVNFAESGNYTIILTDLVVSGFVGSNNSTEECSLPQSGSCSFASNSTRTFVVKHKMGATRQFDVIAVGNTVTNRIDPNYSGPYQFFCYTDGNQEPAPCTSAKKIRILYNGSEAAMLSYSMTTANGIVSISGTTNQLFNVALLSPGFQEGEGDDRQEDLLIESGEKLFAVSPNPFSDRLDVHFLSDNTEQIAKVCLYDPHGRLVMTQHSEPGQQIQTLSTESLSPGMYFLRVEAGDKVEMIKVVKTQ